MDADKPKENEKFFDTGNQEQASFPKPPFMDRVRLLLSDFFSAIRSRSKVFLYILGALSLFAAVLAVWRFWVSDFFKPPPPPPPVLLIQAVSVEKTWLLPRSENTSVGVFHLSNKNRSRGFASIPYTWRFWNSEEKIFARGTSTVFLLPEQDRFLLIPMAGQASRFDITLLPHKENSALPLVGPEIKLEAVNVKGQNVGEEFLITGRVSNRTAYVFYEGFVTGLVRNASGDILAAVGTRVENIKPGEFKDFALAWPKRMPSNISVDVRAEANTMSEVNFGLVQPSAVDSREGVR